MVMAIKMKIMPKSPETNLEEIKKEAEKIIKKEGGKNCKFEKEAVAFGLNAIIAFFAWPEEKELEKLEKKLEKINDVNSVYTIDIRRAFG